ncbi:hypothetical protein LTR62_002143 [Meristemomyces frigidus]|uniref:Uncharacterized protein n=1 Tax=Meristemomyces frigidus TaxID=1508187 RepID=A0AAN7YFX2_9PEZI|nr:hypothetical protein LTR62_002143 [Meristemomyces frigidus]
MQDERQQLSAMHRTFATAELLEHILLYLISDLHPIADQEDPRSDRTSDNASKLHHLLRCTEICHTWQANILASGPLQRALFLAPDHNTKEKRWQHNTPNPSPQTSQISQRSYYRCPPSLSTLHRAPLLNPLIQTLFPSYHFRFWHLSLEATGNKHVAYLIITRRDLPDLLTRSRTKQGLRVSEMQFSRPPLTGLEATIWEERDETREYVGRTFVLGENVMQCEGGLTLGFVHAWVGRMFENYQDVAAIKLTTT